MVYRYGHIKNLNLFYKDENIMNFYEWQKNYHEKEIIKLKEELTKKEIKILERLGIEIKDKTYTEYEYEILKLELIKYYKNYDMDKEELKKVKPLINKITRSMYNELLEKFYQIDKKNENLFNKISF